jgi:quercetin dioxygenase-like cupin family protein
MPQVHDWPRPEWTPVPRPGVVGVAMRLLDYTEGVQLIAQLRFDPNATIDEHDAPYPIDVYCLEGSGFTSIDGVAEPISAGQSVHWPADTMHCVWTEGSRMLTLMHEHIGNTTGGRETA